MGGTLHDVLWKCDDNHRSEKHIIWINQTINLRCMHVYWNLSTSFFIAFLSYSTAVRVVRQHYVVVVKHDTINFFFALIFHLSNGFETLLRHSMRWTLCCIEKRNIVLDNVHVLKREYIQMINELSVSARRHSYMNRSSNFDRNNNDEWSDHNNNNRDHYYSSSMIIK